MRLLLWRSFISQLHNHGSHFSRLTKLPLFQYFFTARKLILGNIFTGKQKDIYLWYFYLAVGDFINDVMRMFPVDSTSD